MQLKILSCILLCILFQQLVEISCQTTSSNPSMRRDHTATVINNKLYILGGEYYSSGNNTNEFLYLDFSSTFSTKSLTWQNLSDNTIPAHAGATTVVGGMNNNTLFLYGGSTTDTTMKLVYTFDPINKAWNIPDIVGAYNDIKLFLTGIINNNKKMYLCSGVSENDMVILDTVNLSWGIETVDGAPPLRTLYGAVLLPDQTIIYMGGYDFVDHIQYALNRIYIYDTINNHWSERTTGLAPIGRDSFSAVLGLDGKRIIIFGGRGANNNSADLPPKDALYVLNLTSFQWFSPNVNGQIPSSRTNHKANVISNYMVISFGLGYDQSKENDILLLDISNNDEYIWTDTFNPSASLSPLPPSASTTSLPSIPSPPPPTIKPVIISAIIGTFLGCALLLLGSFFIYRWKNKYKRIQINTMAIDYF